jgi:predicted nuclease with RNAse H fold
MQLAAKYEEMFPPECRELVTLTDRAYTIQEILEMEETICKALEFRFTAPTVHSFICRYVKAAHADT